MEKKSFCRVMPPHWLGMVDALGTVPWAHIVNPALTHSIVVQSGSMSSLLDDCH